MKAADKEPDYYGILQVSPQASEEVIRAAYKAIAKKIHPDKGGSQHQTADLNAAYEVLIDPFKREEYNQTRDSRLELRIVERQVIVACCLSCGRVNRITDLSKLGKARCKACGRNFVRSPEPESKKREESAKMGEIASVFCFHCGTKNRIELEEDNGNLAPFSSALMQASCANCGFPFRDHVR
ncbi:MAG TPA: J domain-containing protein [Chroococcales cyanobacterium]